MSGLSTDRPGKPALGGPLESVVRHLVSFRCDRRGNVAIMFAFAFIPAMLAGGAAVDYSRASSARAEMQTAVDAAALGVARDGATMNDAEIQTHGRRFFDANFQAGSGVTVGSFAVARQGKTITVTANASIKTATLSAVSVDKIEFAAVGKTMWGSSKIELALALDNTGSMDSSGKMTALKDAANNLLDILEKSAVEADSFKVSIVPFNTQVKVGTAAKDASWLYYPTSGVSSSLVVEKDKWKGCLVDRSKDYDTDASPAVAGNNNTLYPAVKCAESGLTLLRPLTNDWANLHTTVNNMTPDGFTNVTIGLAWALTQLTPDAPLSKAKPWETESLTKIIILLTDGENTQNRFTTNSAQIDERTELACTHVKHKKIRLYTIRVIDGNADLLRNCATTTSMHYDVQNASQLNPVFEAIGNEIASIRLTQ
jgi:Flp pilus assembly protein TadG